ncbi:FAD/NAD-P-binding domain-containing protein [Calocera viscosa TUFC12733]|uniref:FAD/NAD-P-binding domain-containing protein n=1 Tax=Calocera viscosa (strain TUFC12733) TaxID=1330018 RepID=A0A167IRG2_CALVF|nr:FAD/NAD-P-binding domain-containing protein [Calocera viscosa TUFC12733]
MLLNRGSGAEASLAEVVAFWIFKFNSARRARDPAQALTELFSSDPWWRDHLALTWDLRTFHTLALILDFLRETLERTGCGPFCLVSNSVQLVQMGGQISFVYASFTFETNYATCSGGLKLLPGPRGQWHAWNVYTRIEELKGHEQNLRRLSLRDTQVDTDFDVVVLGSGQCGLQIAAASKAIGMRVLIVEQNGRLGDQWRRHYDSLRLHLPKHHSQFLYRPFPPSMPLYPSKNDIADFLEHYAQVCNLNVLCSSWIQNATFDHDSETWVLDVRHRHRSSSRIRTGQLVFATGILGSSPTTLDIPDKSSYPGCVLHSVQYKSGSGWRGKRAIVVGAGTSGHDIAEDLYSHGADVLIVQRSSTAVVSKKLAIMYFAQHYPAGSSPDNVDRALESTPVLLNRQLAAAAAGFMEQVDAPLRAGLARAGFLFTDPDAAQMLYGRFGGYYVDTGCSGLIIEGKIKLKADIPIMSFTQRGLRFADGVEAPAELIVFATGYDTGTMRALAIQLVGPEIGGVLKEPWGMDEEGEVNAVWRNSGHSHLWYHGGDFKAARYYSKLVALQILATKLGILDRYQS